MPAGTAARPGVPPAGQGVQRLDGAGKGDHIARVRLVVPRPRDLSAEQIDLLRQLAEVEGSEVREGRGVLGKVKDSVRLRAALQPTNRPASPACSGRAPARPSSPKRLLREPAELALGRYNPLR